MVRKLQTEDLAWVSEHYSDSLAKLYALGSMEYSLVYEENHVVKDALLTAKSDFDGAKGVYIYSRQKDEMQNSLIQSDLLNALEKDAATDDLSFIFTAYCDSEPYKASGFKAAFPMRKMKRNFKRNLWAVADFDTITANKLPILREKYIKSAYASPLKGGYASMMTGMYNKGAITAENYGAYAIMYRLETELLITELYAKDDAAAMHLIEAAGDNYARETATILLSCENEVFMGEGEKYHGGLIKTIGKCPNADLSYNGMLIK
ncbi:MAG: hypothetical protein RSC96_06110 [Oscillospiraceae bacterium]